MPTTYRLGPGERSVGYVVLFQDNLGGRPWMRGVTAFPPPTRYGPRSQAFSPCRASDPGSRDSGHRRREPAAAELAAAAARSRVPPTLIGMGGFRVRLGVGLPGGGVR